MKLNGRNWLRRLGATTLLVAGGCQTTRDTKLPETFRVMTYNIHHGEGLDGIEDLQRIAAVIQREHADIVALQEVDKGVLRTERRDLPAELAVLTGMTCVFSNNFHYQGGEYGNAVLTRFPVLNATNSHYQMLRTNEQRGIQQLTLEVHGRALVVMNTHVDPRRDDAERLLNAQEIRALVAQNGGTPLVLCGDFNDTPGSRVYQQLGTMFDDAWEVAGQGQGWTYSADQPRKRIDYVWLSKNGDLRPIKAYIPTSDASDHLPLVVLLQFR
jgi:endonuclease/exonuclease/phosphatase family metal-dependent hydrolase